MITKLILCTLTKVLAAEQTCEGTLFDEAMHKKETLKKDVNSPYQFNIDYNSNVLFLSYTTYAKDSSSRFQSAYLNLETKYFSTIPTKNGFASAVDPSSNRIYLGAQDGIYTFNLTTRELYHIADITQSIWQMFYRNGLYYTTYPKEEAYLYKDGKSHRLAELNKSMLIGSSLNGNIYFSNSSGLFEYKKTNESILQLSEKVINGINADINGKLYFTTPDGIFLIDEKSDKVKRLLAINNVHAAVIEKDGSVVYGTDDSIIRIRRKPACFI